MFEGYPSLWSSSKRATGKETSRGPSTYGGVRTAACKGSIETDWRADNVNNGQNTWKAQNNTNQRYRRNDNRGYHCIRQKAANEQMRRNDHDCILAKTLITTLSAMGPTETSKKLNENLKSLEDILNSSVGSCIEEEFLKNVLHVIATCCHVSSSVDINPLLTVLKNSSFFSNHIKVYLQFIQFNDSKMSDIDQTMGISNVIRIFTTYLRHFPSSYSDIPLEMLQRTLEVLQVEEKIELENGLAALKSERDEVIKAERRRFAKPIKKEDIKQIKPPESYREIQICPTLKELNSSEKPFLRKNIKKGNYENAEHYLDVQFRLYREDFIAPLREGIQEVVNQVPRRDRNQNIKLYHNVRVGGKEFTKSGIVYKLIFDPTRFRFTNWNHSKRLIFGSFLCLSRDKFKTMMFATVANRDPEELKKGRFDIHFVKGQEVIGIEKRNECFIVAESPAYFEAYRHVLVGLQGMTEDNLPFKKYLVQCSPDVDLPLYLRRNEEQDLVIYNLAQVFKNRSLPPVKVLVTDEWPQAETLPLNASQLDAFQTAITKEFTVIQGPPGTGKTYVGLKIVQALLQNRRVWDPWRASPMLMVCFTNHALDQFLEGVLKFLSNGIIRVGGRCKSAHLHRFNLRTFVDHDTRRSRIYSLMKAWEYYIGQAWLFSESPNNVNLTFDHLEEVIENRFLNQLYYSPNLIESKTVSDLFRAWVLNKYPAMKTQSGEKDSITTRQETNRAQTSEHFHETINKQAEERELSREAEQLEDQEQESFFISESKRGLVEDQVQDDSVEILSSFVSQTSKRITSQTEKSLSDTANTSNEIGEQGNKDKNGEDKESGVVSGEDYAGNNSNERTTDIEYGQTIIFDQEVDFIQSQRYQEGEEDMFSPIRNVSDSVSDQDRDVLSVANGSSILNGEDEDKTWSSQSKRQCKHQPSNITVSIEDLKRVNKLLLEGKSFESEDISNIDDMWQLSENKRIRLYLYWLGCFRQKWRMAAEQAEQTYDILCNDLDRMKADEDYNALREATVIGMTTSCAARYHSVLQQIRPKIVVIEEAAEVLEAHILTSLTQDTEHLILIGDHKQLRPKPTVYQLAQKFNLEISLFERMVLNKMECKQLSIQHRMRPEIARLTKRIYDHEIIDSEIVQRYPDIDGIQKNMFFLDHTEPEEFREGLQSYSNKHEADFVVALCRYLLQQGYQSSQITILTMYTGQMLEIKQKMPLAQFKGVHLSAVDNFQGEENDIVLLSLVRSNKEQSVGFLREPNRICVSLSRARMGLYVVGNFSLMCSQSPLWIEICKDLEREGQLGSTMSLICKKHGNVTGVETGKDFKKVAEGGCSEPCEDRLQCGHVCNLLCHAGDPEHVEYRCRKRCLQRCRGGHPCDKTCHYGRDCGQCNVVVTKIFPDCGHDTKTACRNDIQNLRCVRRCKKILECGHRCSRYAIYLLYIWSSNSAKNPAFFLRK